MNFLSLFSVISAAVISIWASIKYLLVVTIRVDDSIGSLICAKMEKAKYKLNITNDFSLENKEPQVYKSIAYYQGMIVYVDREERLLQAGWQGKENITSLVAFRWNADKLREVLTNIGNSDTGTVLVQAITPYSSFKLGELNCKDINEPYIPKSKYEDIEQDIAQVLDGKKDKTGCLLYGPPGTGKTQLVKYFAKKYRLPIYMVYLDSEYSNLDISKMFAKVPTKCILLFEDFDNYFNGRECVMKNDKVRFTFDSIINGLDGIYNDYKQVVFAMTANDLSKIDDSIKARPSRLKFVRELGSPDYNTRLKILGSNDMATKSEGLTLDQVLFMRDTSNTNKQTQLELNIN